MLAQAYTDAVNKARFQPPAERFAFAYARREGYRPDGWGIFDPLKEYERMGLPGGKWRLSTANENYELCSV